MVGTARFELVTPSTPRKCATKLRHVPTQLINYTILSVSLWKLYFLFVRIFFAYGKEYRY